MAIITGKVFVLGDNIDTDQIIPAQYLNLVPTIPEEYEKLGSYALAGLPATCPPFVAPGKTKTAYAMVTSSSKPSSVVSSVWYRLALLRVT